MERNPLTGGAKLVPPPGAQFVISKRQKCAWLAPGMEGRSKGKPRSSPRTNLSMPTIGESSVISNVDYDYDYDENFDDDEDDEEFDPEVPLKRPLRTRSCRFPSASSLASKKHYSILRRPPLRMTTVEVPAAAGGAAAGKRRHSYQSGVPGLAKDMDRLRVSAAAANAGGNQGSGQGRSPRGSTRRRASSARRSSRSGFLHFLDLAIAN